MRKRPSKRKIIARFMLGKWVKEKDMVRHQLYYHLSEFSVEVDEPIGLIRRNPRRRTDGSR